MSECSNLFKHKQFCPVQHQIEALSRILVERGGPIRPFGIHPCGAIAAVRRCSLLRGNMRSVVEPC